MERLTEWVGIGEERRAIPRTDLRRNGHNACCNKLAEYEDLEEQGLLLKLPCKCDEVVWVAEKGFKPHTALYSCPSAMLDDIEHGRCIVYTKEEAEKVLAEMEEK